MNFTEYTNEVLGQCRRGSMPFLTKFYPTEFTADFVARYISVSWGARVSVENCAASLEGLFQEVYDEKVASIPMKES